MKHIITSIAISLAAGFALNTSQAIAGGFKSGPHFTYTSTIEEQAFRVELEQLSNSNSVRLTILKAEGKKLFVKLVDPEGMQVFNFVTPKNPQRVGRDYNFNDAAEGTYIFEVSDGFKKVKKEMKLKRTSAAVVTRLVVE